MVGGQPALQDEIRRPQRVRGAKEEDNPEPLQAQLEKFFLEQWRWHEDLKGRLRLKLDGVRETLPLESVTAMIGGGKRRKDGRGTGCFNCGRQEHYVREWRQWRRNPRNGNQGLEAQMTGWRIQYHHTSYQAVTLRVWKAYRLSFNQLTLYLISSHLCQVGLMFTFGHWRIGMQSCMLNT